MASGRPPAAEPSEFQKRLILLVLEDRQATRHGLADALGCSIESVRYHLSVLKIRRWAPVELIDGIEERRLPSGRPRGARNRPKYCRPSAADPARIQSITDTAGKIVDLLRRDRLAVERLYQLLHGGEK